MTEIDEAETHRRRDCCDQSRLVKRARCLVDGEGNDCVAVLICREQESSAGLDAEITRRATAGFCMPQRLKLARLIVHRERCDTVMAPVGAVQKATGRVKMDVGAAVAPCELRRQRCNRLDLVQLAAILVRKASDTGALLVDAIQVALVRMERRVTRSCSVWQRRRGRF